jgi:hypothetical protein
MKVCLALILIAINSFFSVPDEKNLWKLYKQAAIEEQACDNMLSSLNSYNENNSPIYAGYKASALILKAKYAFNPVNKYSFFSKGTILLDKCILANKSNIELRFLRLSIQIKSPSFLGYNKNIKEDKELVVNDFDKMTNTEWKQFASDFLLDSGTLTPQEKSKISNGAAPSSGR